MKKTKTKKQFFANPLYRNSTVLKAVKKLEMTVNMKQSKSRKNLNLNKNLSDTSPSQVENDDEFEPNRPVLQMQLPILSQIPPPMQSLSILQTEAEDTDNT